MPRKFTVKLPPLYTRPSWITTKQRTDVSPLATLGRLKNRVSFQKILITGLIKKSTVVKHIQVKNNVEAVSGRVEGLAGVCPLDRRPAGQGWP